MRFNEKGVDQIYKDFTVSILNAYKFFETYANVDKRSTTKNTIYFMRHAKAEGLDKESPITAEGSETMKDKKFIEQVLRMDPDVIYTSPATRAIQTAEEIARIMKDIRGKKVKIKKDEKLRSGE